MLVDIQSENMFRLGVRYPFMPPIWEDAYQYPKYKLPPHQPIGICENISIDDDLMNCSTFTELIECPSSLTALAGLPRAPPLVITIDDAFSTTPIGGSPLSPLSPLSPQTRASWMQSHMIPPPPPTHKRQMSGSGCGNEWRDLQPIVTEVWSDTTAVTPTSHRSSIMSSPCIICTPPPSPASIGDSPTSFASFDVGHISSSAYDASGATFASFISLGRWLPQYTGKKGK